MCLDCVPVQRFRKVYLLSLFTSLQAGQPSERSTTIILLSVVITFIICSLPMTLISVLRLGQTWDEINLHLYGSIIFYMATLLININSAINFLLFCVFGKKFRALFIKIFIRCKCRLRQRISYTPVSQTMIMTTNPSFTALNSALNSKVQLSFQDLASNRSSTDKLSDVTAK